MTKKVFFLICILLISVEGYSQNSDEKLIEKLIERGVLTQEDAQDILGERMEEPESVKKREVIKSLIDNKYLRLGGYAQLLYTYSNTKEVKHDGAVRSAFLSVRGEPADKLSYLVFANLRDPSLTEYYVDWRPLGELQFRAGQQKVPLSIENQLSLSALEFIQNSRTVNHLIGGGKDVLTIQNGKSSGGRDIGIKAYGNLFVSANRPIVEYNAGLYQGSGINKSAPRSDKDFIFNALVSPATGFRIGGGMQFGEAKYSADGKSVAIHGRDRWLISSDYRSDNFTARAEWINGRDGSIKKEGVYGMVTWSVMPDKWVLLGKADYYNNDKSLNLEVTDYSAGVNLLINKFCRIQANYTYSDYTQKWGNKNSHLAEAQFQIIY